MRQFLAKFAVFLSFNQFRRFLFHLIGKFNEKGIFWFCQKRQKRLKRRILTGKILKDKKGGKTCRPSLSKIFFDPLWAVINNHIQNFI